MDTPSPQDVIARALSAADGLVSAGLPFYATLIRDLVAALEARQWQPMETAPKDGTHILIWGPFQTLEERVRGHAYWSGVWITHPIDRRYNDRIIPELWAPMPEARASSEDGRGMRIAQKNDQGS
jgi:hypothetical protein